jgi:ADP-heptose:LPS heptosyltransferase
MPTKLCVYERSHLNAPPGRAGIFTECHLEPSKIIKRCSIQRLLPIENERGGVSGVSGDSSHVSERLMSWRFSGLDVMLCYIVRIARQIVFFFCDLKFCARQRSADPCRVLLVRLDSIGDFVLWLDGARALRSMYPSPEFRVILIGNAVWADLAKSLGVFDEVIALDPREFQSKLGYRYRLMREVRKKQCGVVIHPTFTREFWVGDSVVRMCGAQERIGFSGDCSNIRRGMKYISDRWYTQLVPADPESKMELLRNAEFVRGLSGKGFDVRLPSIESGGGCLPASLEGRQYYVLFVGAAWPGRRWPATLFGQLARRIFDLTGWQGVICGGVHETGLAEEVLNCSSVPVENWVGRTNLVELVSIIDSARFVVANETSAIHIAAACRTPSVCIVGGGHFGRFVPYPTDLEHAESAPLATYVHMSCYGCNWRCVYDVEPNAPVPCIERVTVDQVWTAVLATLDRSGVNI